MTDKQLQYILEIANEGSITAAAQKLFVSQPSLSALLAKVEEELGVKIFNRGETPLTLTYEGKYYIKAARSILGTQKEMYDILADIKHGDRGKVVVGCGQQSSSILLPLILPRFIADNPGIKLELIEDQVSVFEKMLMSDRVDLAFVTYPFQNELLDHTVLYHEEVVLIAPENFQPDAVERKSGHLFPVLDARTLRGNPFVLFKQGRFLRRMAERILEEFEVAPNVILETSSWETCLGMTRAGLAFTLLPCSPFLDTNLLHETRCFSIDGKYFREISLYYKKREFRPLAQEKFITFTRDTIDNYIKTNAKIQPI